MTERGASLVELLVSMGLSTTSACAMLALVVAAQSIARIQPESSDQQQRARVVSQVLSRELARAGLGSDRGSRAGPLVRYFPPIARSADEGLTVWYVESAGGLGTLSSALLRHAVAADIVLEPPCTGAPGSCGFTDGSTALVFDEHGCHDVARVEHAAPASLALAAASRVCDYSAGATVVEGRVRTYRVDPVARQLLRRDEGTGISVPLVDSVSRMTIDALETGRVRVIVSIAPVLLLHVPEIVVTIDSRPHNVREPGWPF